MENLQIPNSAITASSSWPGSAYLPYKGRLNSKEGWFAYYQDTNQWFQVDFGGVTQVTGISTQGYSYLDRWVTSYTLSYSNTGLAPFTPYQQQSFTKVEFIDTRFSRTWRVDWVVRDDFAALIRSSIDIVEANIKTNNRNNNPSPNILRP